MLFVVLKPPPAKILPSACTAIGPTVPFAFGSKPSSADCPRTAAAPPASAKPTRAIKLNRADERNLFPAEFFIFGFSSGLESSNDAGCCQTLTLELQARAI